MITGLNKKEILRIITELASKRAPSGLENARGAEFKKQIEMILVDKEIPVKKDSLGNYYAKPKGKSAKKSMGKNGRCV